MKKEFKPTKFSPHITAAEAAERAGITRMGMTKWCKQFGIGRKVAGRWWVDPIKLDQLLRGELNERKNSKTSW